MAHLGHTSSPAVGIFSLNVDLEYVNRQLEAFANESPQRRRIALCDASPPCLAPPFPDPMIPCSFFRHWASHKAQQMQSIEPSIDHRWNIDDIDYWRTEARCYISSLGDVADLERQKIHDWIYWRLEAKFWKDACCDNDFTAERWQIQDAQYWKIEVRHLGKLLEKRSQASDIRRNIQDLNYWKTETFHYDDLLREVVPQQSITLEEIQATSTLQQTSECKTRKLHDDGERNTSSPNSWLASWNAVHRKSHDLSLPSEVYATTSKKRRVAKAG